MKLFFLGTGAADWPFVNPDRGDARRMSAALLDDCLLIDPGPDIANAFREFGKDFSQVKYVINTHRHGDHYNQETLQTCLAAGAEFFPLKAGEQVQCGKYTIRALQAHHGTCAEAVHFIITDGTSTLFYGLDSAWLLYEEYVALKECGADFAVLDATIGDAVGDYRVFEHNNLRMVLEMKATLQPYIKRFCISHMARTLHDPHPVLAANMAPHGVEVAYDGWEAEF